MSRGVCFSLVVLGSVCSLAAAQDPAAELRDPEEVTTLVHAAAQLVERTGTRAFDEFRSENTRWLHGQTQVLVYDLEGRAIVDALHPQAVGRSQMQTKDPQGRPVVASILAACTGLRTRGWSHYLATPAGETQPAWKSTYATQIALPDEQVVIVAAGFFGRPTSPYFVEETVNMAVEELAERGGDALKSMNTKLSLYNYADTGVMVFNTGGQLLAAGGLPNLEGRSAFQIRDADGNSPAREMIESVSNSDVNWVKYPAVRPGEAEPGLRAAFVRKLAFDDQTLLISASCWITENDALGIK